MIQALPKPVTFDEFVAWYPDGQGRYELHNGVIVEMLLGTGDNRVIAISAQEKEAILAIASGLPPDQWKSRCRTQSQRQHWDDIKITFQAIYAELESHFLGTPSKVKIADPESAELVTLAFWRYLELYEVARHGWHPICNLANSIGLQIPPTPGDFLIAILQQDCKAMFEQCTRYYEFNPRKIESLCRLAIKIDRGKASEREKNKYENEIIKLSSMIGDLPLSVLCLGVGLTEQNSCAGLKEAINRLKATEAKITAITLRAYHPNKRQRAYAWVKGEKGQLYKTQ